VPRLRERVRALGRALPSLADADQPAQPEPPPGRPILLVHGFAASSRVLLPLERWLVRTLGRPVFRLRLGQSLPVHTGDVRASALRIQRDLERLARAGGFRELDVVGHSMGGLVATYLFKAIDRGQRVRNVVTLGSPHRGTPLALAGLLVLGVLTRASATWCCPASITST
jgi:triacylglycerol esterase/lipase EstA (alpha/beta hydrolase family)